MKLNKDWHLLHPMTKNASIDERILWHIKHQKHCCCREIPLKVKEEMKKRKIKMK